MLKINKKKIRPYGDRLDDGAMQLSFTLPVDASPEAKAAAKMYVEKLGLKNVAICSMESMGKGFTCFVAYGFAKHTIDFTRIRVPKVDMPSMDFDSLKEYMDRNLDRQLVVIGAATGSDAHTVGIDAIMNMKGFAHDYGLERYPMFKAHNLRSQLTNKQLIDKAVELKADAILISQVVTQRDSHLKNLKGFRDLWKKDKRISKDVVVIIGGPRLDHAHALKLGFDAGFGPGTKPSFVANFIVREYMKRAGIKEKKDAKGAPPIAEQAVKEKKHASARNTESPKRERRSSRQKPEQPQPARVEGETPTAKKKKTRRGRRGGRRRNKSKPKSSETK